MELVGFFMINSLSNEVLLETAKRFGTPVYLYDLDCIQNKYSELREMLLKECDIFYSMKANPSIEICRQFKSYGACCEVSCGNELLMALTAGFEAKNIIFVGPGKKKNELILAVEQDIRYIICESIEEIELIQQIAKNKNKLVKILIRINPDFIVAGAPIKMSGVATQFGLDIASFLNNIDKLNACTFLCIDGIQIYNASRVLHFDSIIKNIKNIFALSKELAYLSKIHFSVIDFGGGFGVPYFENENTIPVKLLISEINLLIEDYKKENPNMKFIMELGRYLVSESGYFISSIQSIKNSHDKKYIILDGGMHCHLASTGIGSFVHRNFPMRHISFKKRAVKERLDEFQISGPLCTPGDILLRNVVLPPVFLDDLIVIEKTGAYGLTASPGKFLSHGSPAEVVWDDSVLRLIRRKEELSDLLATQL